MKKSETMYAIAVYRYGMKHYGDLIERMEWDRWMDFVLWNVNDRMRRGELKLVNRLTK